MKAILTKHFKDRVSERLPGVKPKNFAEGAIWALINNRIDILRPSGRTKFSRKEPSRHFQFEAPNGGEFELIVSDEIAGALKFITVVPIGDRQAIK